MIEFVLLQGGDACRSICCEGDQVDVKFLSFLSSFCPLLVCPEFRPGVRSASSLGRRDTDEQRDSKTWKTTSFLNLSSDSFLLLPRLLHSIHLRYSRPVSSSDDAGSLFKVKGL